MTTFQQGLLFDTFLKSIFCFVFFVLKLPGIFFSKKNMGNNLLRRKQQIVIGFLYYIFLVLSECSHD